MKTIIKLFGIYFFILIVIEGSILIFADAKYFDKCNMKDISKKSRIIGTVYILITFILTIISNFIM